MHTATEDEKDRGTMHRARKWAGAARGMVETVLVLALVPHFSDALTSVRLDTPPAHARAPAGPSSEMMRGGKRIS